MNYIVILFALFIILFFSFYNAQYRTSYESMDTMEELLQKIHHQNKRRKKLKKKGKKGKSKKKANNMLALQEMYEELLAKFNDTKDRIKNKLNSVNNMIGLMKENKDKQHNSIQNTRELIKIYLEEMRIFELLS